MKKESQPHNQLPDGSQYYGNGVWGPSAADLQRASLSFNEKPKIKEEPNNDLIFISQESAVGRLLQTMSRVRLPTKLVIPVGLAVAVVAVACGSKNSEKSKLPSTPRPSESSAPPRPENIPPFAVLNMPFLKDTKMGIQQGWFYTGITGKKEHKGIDFIKGDVDNSTTWGSFPVLAAADGFACANPPSREGNAVLLTHLIGDAPIGSTYYGHLDAIEKDMPACDDKGKFLKFKKQGAKLGDAGATGVKDDRGIEQPAWKHLHFQVNDAKGNPIDPYDLKGERNIYPDPNFKNGKPCGPKALFIDCYPKGAVVASPKNPIPQISSTITAKEVFPATATPRPTETPSPTATLAPTPKPTEIKKPTQTLEMPILDLTSLVGDWVNNDPNTAGIIEIILREEGGKLRVHSFGRCTPTPCDWEEVNGVPSSEDASASIANAFTAHYDFGFAEKNLKGRRERDRLLVQQYTVFKDNSGRPNYVSNDSFKVLSSGYVEKQKSTSTTEKKISISKKPDELFKALLTNAVSSDVLPQGMSSGGISASEIDATGKALKQIGAVNISIEDSVSSAMGLPNGGISYAIFPDASTAKSASELIGAHLQNGRDLKEFPYPAKVYTQSGFFGAVAKVVLIPVENVTVAVSFTGTDSGLLESRAISLSQAALKHLEKVGR